MLGINLLLRKAAIGTLIFLIAIPLLLLTIIFNGNPLNIFSLPCLDHDESLSLPGSLQGTTIEFHSPMQYVNGLNKKWGFCTPITARIDRMLTQNDPNFIDNFTPENFKNGVVDITQIPSSYRFKIIRGFQTVPNFLITDAGSIKYFLVEDQTGIQSIITTVELGKYGGDAYYANTSEPVVVPHSLIY